MSKLFLMKVFTLPANTLHRLGALSQPVVPHCPSQGQGRTGGSLGRPSPGHQPLPWGKWWPRLGQELRHSSTTFPRLQRNGPAKAALSLRQTPEHLKHLQSAHRVQQNSLRCNLEIEVLNLWKLKIETYFLDFERPCIILTCLIKQF